MPLPPEEPPIHASAQGPSTVPASSATVPTPRPVPGPRPAAVPRPGRPGAPRPTAPVQRTAQRRGPGPGAAGKQPAPATPQIQLVPSSPDGALDAADEAVDLLLDSGRSPGEVLVLTTGEAHPWAAHELSFGEDAYWAQHEAGEDVFHAPAEHAVRTGRRPVVVVAVNGGSDAALAAALPLALGKASALMVVCGDPARINGVLGSTGS